MTVLPAPFRWDGDHVRASLPGGEVLFTTRRGGVSSGPYASLNLGLWTEDEAQRVAVNREIVAAAVGWPIARVRQVHGAEVVAAGSPDTPIVEADGLVTDRSDLAVGVLVADCLPVLLVADGGVAAIHAGWRGLAAGVVEHGLTTVRASTAAPVTAAIGPGARGCCYEVGDEVREALAEHGDEVRDGRRIDLPAIARRILERLGVATVHDTGICTLCAPEGLWFSHRRDGGVTGRQMGIAWRS